MVIPNFDFGGVLPPFGSAGPTSQAGGSPYHATILELTKRFATSKERRSILKGLLDFRKALRDAGFNRGFQWIDGSFVEDCEGTRRKPPADVDIVSLLFRPAQAKSSADWSQFVSANSQLLDPILTKATYRCDAYFVDLNIDPDLIVRQATYFFSLFSHQRTSFRWKGMVQVPFLCDDDAAESELIMQGLLA
jgi:hypothetical protein